MESTVRRHRPPAKWLAAATAALLLLALLPFASVTLAATSITAATGGSAISVDTAATGGTGAYTALTGPSMSSTVAGEFSAASVTLTAPGGFEFHTSGWGFTPSGVGCNGITIGAPSATTTVLTVALSGSTLAGGCTLSYTGVEVRPTAGGPLPVSGNLTLGGIVSGAAGTLTEVVGAAAKLGFAQQPTGFTVNAAWPSAQQPLVRVLDQFNNPITSDTRAVTLAIGTNPSGGTLTCSGGLGGVAGTAYTGCKIDAVGNGYTLTASASGLAHGTTSAFNITQPVLVFTTPPVGNVAYGTGSSSNFTTSPTVTVKDAANNTISSTAIITLALLAPTLGELGTLSCDQTSGGVTSMAAVGGIAAFTSCKVTNRSGAGYTLRASATGMTSAVSGPFDIYSQTRTKLVFSTQPGGGTGGAAWIQQPTVQIQDANGQIAIQDVSTTVTLAIGTNPGTPSAGVLTCTNGLSHVVANGVAAFTGCAIDRQGTGYSLTASSSPVLTGATSSAFNITAGTAVKLGFTAQPGNSTSNVAFTTQPVVAIQDAGGNTVTIAPSTTVTLAIGANPAAGVLTCTSGLSRATVNGVATFSGCAINNAGVGYTITASSSSYTPATSTAFNVTAPTAALSISASPTAVNRLQSTVLTIQFAAYGATRSVAVQKKAAGDSDWVTVGVLVTDSLGKATVQVTPATSTQYRAYYAGSADLLTATSAPITVGVRYTTALAPKTSTGSTTVSKGTKKTYTGTMRPIMIGQRMSFMIYKWVNGAWVFQTSATIAANTSGQATFTWSWSKSGKWYIRVRANADAWYATAWSNLEKVTVP